ncbi:MAG: P-loop NTPase [Deltaproteobacteria bacterium]|nr:P-loop NTPase [Deltaproteobacteria bacterium]
MGDTPTIIPIASGKGGVGKTFLAANLAIALAEMGHATVAVDLDFGGPNLHSFLGIPNLHPGIGDFLKARTGELPQFLVKTDIPDLTFLPGDGRTPFMSNISYAEKRRLITHLGRIRTEYLLLDLGAGTSFNTLDFFRLSRSGMLVITPEYPSIMNMLSFLKQFLLRTIERKFVKNDQIVALLRSEYKQPITNAQGNITVLQEKIGRFDDRAGREVEKICQEFRPRMVFNMGDDPDEITIAAQINRSLKEILSMSADYFGFVLHDDYVRESVKKRKALLPSYGQCVAAQDIRKIAHRILSYWERPIENSDQILLKSTKKLHESLPHPDAGEG